eukprot:13252392-Alexandrium_andersonii.AAC.1
MPAGADPKSCSSKQQRLALGLLLTGARHEEDARRKARATPEAPPGSRWLQSGRLGNASRRKAHG